MRRFRWFIAFCSVLGLMPQTSFADGVIFATKEDIQAFDRMLQQDQNRHQPSQPQRDSRADSTPAAKGLIANEVREEKQERQSGRDSESSRGPSWARDRSDDKPGMSERARDRAIERAREEAGNPGRGNGNGSGIGNDRGNGNNGNGRGNGRGRGRNP